MIEKNSFGSTLKRLREEKQKKWIERKQWTQTAVAKRIGVSRTAYIAWETDTSLPDVDNLKRIIEVFRPDEKDEAALYRLTTQTPRHIHNLPKLAFPFFTGRETYLKQLSQYFEDGKQLVFFHGRLHIGKTAIALAYAHRSYHQMKYRAVFWLDATNRDTLQTGYDALADLLELPERQEGEADRRMQAVNRWLETHTNWLLIMDGVHEMRLIFQFLPLAPAGHIVVTTRHPVVADINMPVATAEIHVEAMEPEEGMLLLLRSTGILSGNTPLDAIAPEVREAARRFGEMLGRDPLTLDRYGEYMRARGIPFTDYAEAILHSTTVRGPLSIDNVFLQEVGLGSLPISEKAKFLPYMYHTLAVRIGERLAKQLTEQQAEEYMRAWNSRSGIAASLWLETAAPNIHELTADEYAKFKAEIAQAAPQILASFQEPPGDAPA